MPLINLQTDLKSLRYGNDRIGGGNSGQPYITTNIPNNISPYIGTTDFLLRGGIRATQDSLVDVARLGKMFIDTKSPNGILFTAKQQLLSRTASRTQTSGLLNEGVYTPLSTLAQAGVVVFGGHLNKQGLNPFEGTGAYSPNPSLYFNAVKPNPNAPEVSTASNRLVQLFELTNNKIPGEKKKGVTLNNGINVMTYTGGPDSNLGIGNTGIRYADQRTGVNNALIVSNPSYFYGKNPRTYTPGRYIDSLYLTSTSNFYSFNPFLSGSTGKYLRLTNNTKGFESEFDFFGSLLPSYDANVYEPAIEGNTWPKNSPLVNANNTYTYTQQDIIDTEINKQGRAGSPTIQDFRKVLRGKLKGSAQTNAINSGATPDAPSYTTENIEQRVNLGDPGQRAGKSYANYADGINYGEVELTTNPGSTGKSLGSYTTGLDKITSVPIYRSNAVAVDSDLNDLVKFRIAILDNNVEAGGQVYKMFLHFRAFLGSMSDSYNATWNAFQYLGRGENFYTYGGFTRQISLSWTVAAQSKQELVPMYKKLNYLASSLTPDYSPQGYMRGNLAQLTVGGYLYEQPGIITGLTYDIGEDSPWEIGINADEAGGQDGTVKEMPHIIKVSGFNFIPIQNFVARKQELTFSNGDTGLVSLDGSGNQRYISLANGISIDNSNYNVYDTSALARARQSQSQINQFQGRGL